MSFCPTDWILGDDRRLHRGNAHLSADLGWALARTYCLAAVLRGISGLAEVELLERCGMELCVICQTAVAEGHSLPERPARERPRILPLRIRSDGGDEFSEPVRDDF
jgi:hypothetical protein